MNIDTTAATLAIVSATNAVFDALVRNNIESPPHSHRSGDLVPVAGHTLQHRKRAYSAFVQWATSDNDELAEHSLDKRVCALQSVLNNLVAKIDAVGPVFGPHFYQVVKDGQTEGYFSGDLKTTVLKDHQHHNLPPLTRTALTQMWEMLNSAAVLKQAQTMLAIIAEVEPSLSAPRLKMK